MKKYAYYHVYLPDDTGCWYNVFLDQIFTMINSGLYDNLEKIYAVCVGKKEQIDLFVNMSICFNKIQIIKCYVLDDNKIEDLSLQHVATVNYKTNNLIDEVYTIAELQEHAYREDAQFLYFHMKGITAPWRMRVEKNHYQAFINYYLWRKFLEWGCIEKWELCTKQLETHSCAGVNFGSWPIPHYSGNFWWTKSEYVKTLPNIKEHDWWDLLQKTNEGLKTWDSNRVKPELWIGTNYDNKFFNILSHKDMPPVSCLVWRYFPRSEYENAA